MTVSASKPAYSFTANVQAFVDHFGIENCGFLTLTFSEKVDCVHEASRRFNSFRTNFLSKVSKGYIGVYERHKSGVIHFHFVVAFLGNIFSEVRGGAVVCFDHEEVKNKRLNRKQRYASANKYLKIPVGAVPSSCSQIWLRRQVRLSNPPRVQRQRHCKVFGEIPNQRDFAT